MESKVKCPTCNGTGNVHSHNPLCWTCGGSGKCSVKEAKEARRLEELVKRYA